MKKKTLVICFIIIAGMIFTAIITYRTKNLPSAALKEASATAAAPAAEFTASVSIDTKSYKEIPLNMTGHHSEMGGQSFRWDVPELIEKARQYDGLGFVRVAGTNLNAYDWKTGAYSEEAIGQLQADDKHYYIYTSSLRANEVKGGDTMEQLREFLHRGGTRVIIPVNVFTNDVRQIGDLAKYCYENHIPVLYFELGNEVSFYTGDAGYNRPDRFDTGTDYLERMRAYDKEIKKYYPGAKTVVAMDNTRKNSFDEDFKNFPDPFWDAVTTHKFQPDGNDVNSAIMATNDGLNFWKGYMDHYVTYSNNARIGIGEQSTALSGVLSMTHYNGITIAESMLRLSSHPNVDYVQSWRIPSGIAAAANDYSDKFEDAYQRNQKIDPLKLTYNFYDWAPAVSGRIVDGAINNSNRAYGTMLEGGTTVSIKSGKIPALYSQAYRGINGKDYLVIVNKSASSHSVTIRMDGKSLKLPMTRTYVTAPPGSKNSTASKPVSMRTEEINAGGTVSIPAYSVTRVEWIRSNTPDTPPVPWLSYADVQSNGVDLKWQRSVNADGYKIKYGTDLKNMKEVDVKNVTTYTVSGLQSGSVYYFAAAAYNAAGTSAFSDTNPSNVAYVKIDKPGAPLMTKYHYENSGRAVIEWQSVPYAKGYKLKYGTAPGTYTNVMDIGNNVGKIVEGLNNGQPYYFVVTAYNNIGESLDSAEVTVTPQAGVPLAPHDLDITPKGDSIELTWLKTRAETDSEYFEYGNADWNNLSGDWTVTNHPSANRDTKVYKVSGTSGTAISLFSNVKAKELEGEAAITVNGTYGPESQVGLIACYSNENSYYKLVFDNKTNKYMLIKQTPDGPVVLAEKTRAKNQSINSMDLKLEIRGNRFISRLGSGELFDKEVIDPNPLPEGYYGLYTYSQEAYFDEVRIRRALGTVNVYRSFDWQGGFTLVASGIEGNSWIDTKLESGKTYFYRVTSVYNSFESYDHSNTVRRNGK